MKLLGKVFNPDKSGKITMIAECDDDLFCLDNILEKGDLLTTKGYRNVRRETSNSTSKFSVSLVLTIKVEKVEYEPRDNILRAKGKNLTENEHVNIGQYHSHDIGFNQLFSIIKHNWLPYYLEMIDEACDPIKRSDVAAVLIQEGIANIFHINKNSTVLTSKIKHEIPRKRNDFLKVREKAINNFYTMVLDSIINNIDFEIVKCVILGGPGLFKNDLIRFMTSQTAEKYTILTKHKDRFLPYDLNSAFRNSLIDIYKSKEFISKIKDTKAYEEMKILEKFIKVVAGETNKALYGFPYVAKAIDEGAVEYLLIADNLLKIKDSVRRKIFFDCIKKVKAYNGTVKIFCCEHETGKELMQYSGLAAILRYPMTNFDDISIEDILQDVNNLKF